jgi:hypothetical protein
MGYYAAGGVADNRLYASHARSGASTSSALAPAHAANSSPPQDDEPVRRRTQVINLTALRRAFRRVDRATRVAHKLFSMKKAGVHGLKFKRHRRKKGI